MPAYHGRVQSLLLLCIQILPDRLNVPVFCSEQDISQILQFTHKAGLETSFMLIRVTLYPATAGTVRL